MIGIDTTFLLECEIAESVQHTRALTLIETYSSKSALAICPQVLAEFIHVSTDPRRFQNPLTTEAAMERSQRWWNAEQVHQVLAESTAMNLFFDWMQRYKLGRKRILDTQLAATYYACGIRHLATSNPQDFALFGVFEFV